MKRHLLLALAVASLSACGGGGGGSVPASAPAKTTPVLVAGKVTLSIPTSSTTSSKVRFPQFVSPNASSVTLAINGGPTNGGTAQTFDVSPTSTLCLTTNGTRDCDLTFGAPVGSDTFVFTIYSGANATGNVLATAPAKEVVVAGSPFSFAVAMSAVLGTVTINLQATNGTSNCQNSPPQMMGIDEGCGGTGTLVISFFDPSGAQITGTTPFAAPGVITISEPTVTASPAQITAPGQNVLLTYSGAPFGSSSTTNSFTVTLTAGGTVIGNFTVAAARQYLYVANSNAPAGTAAPGGGNIGVYAFGASGTAAPARTIAGAATLLENPVAVALDAANDLYVLDNGIYTTQSHPVILEFAPDVNGNIAPIGEISTLTAATSNLPCESIVFDPTKTHLLVSCDDSKIHVFPVSATIPVSGSTVPDGTISSGSFVSPVGMAFDATGNLYVSDTSLDAILYFPNPVQVTGTPNLVATTMGSGGGTAWPNGVNPLSLAIDDQGTLFATISYLSPTAGAQDAGNQLAIWKTQYIPCGNNCAPTAALEGTAFPHTPSGVAFDAAGNVYVSNEFANTVTEFSDATVYGASGTTSNPPVLRTISTGSMPDGPTGIAVGP